MWMMVTFALTWDILGGRMGYNSFGNIVFFGVGMYAAASVQHELYFDIGQFEVISDYFNLQLTPDQYVYGLGLGMAVHAHAVGTECVERDQDHRWVLPGAPGEKDANLVRRFVRAAKSAASSPEAKAS